MNVITEEWLLNNNFFKHETPITIYYIYSLKKNKRLVVTIDFGNVYVFLEEYDYLDFRDVTDSINLFNGDFDGELYTDYLQDLIRVLDYKK